MIDNPKIPNDSFYNTIYRKVKQAIYYDSDLFQKYELSSYELLNHSPTDSPDKIIAICNEIKNILDTKSNSGLSEETKYTIDNWIKEISYYLTPKSVSTSVKLNDTNEENIISNITSSDKYEWGGLNYHIKMPVPLYLLDALWVIYVGSLLDETFEDCCYGNRVHQHLFKEDKGIYSSHLMRNYSKQYSAWRDSALSVAKDALDKGKIVDIITLDITKCFYHIDGDFNEITTYLHKLYKEGKISCLQLYIDLTETLQKICEKYYSVIKYNLELTHNKCLRNDRTSILPIGLRSSGILANWHLHEFDVNVIENLHPYYYGRYVDDCIFVFAKDKSKDTQNTPNQHEFVKDYFIKSGILKQDSPRPIDIQVDLDWNQERDDKSSEKKYSYLLSGRETPYSHLKIQNEKILLIHMDPEHSSAPLDLFIKKIQENSSVFHYLPEEPLSTVDDTGIYNLVFSDGSTNKLRNIKGFSINGGQLSVSLTKQIKQLSLCRNTGKEVKKLIQNMLNDMRGNNYLTYIHTWEKMFSLLLISGDRKYLESVKEVITNICGTISGLQHPPDSVLEIENINIPDKESRMKDLSEELKESLYRQLLLSVSQPLALFNTDKQEEVGNKLRAHYWECRHTDISERRESQDNIKVISTLFRFANMFPQHYVSYPLLNYIKGYKGDLYGVDVFSREFQGLEDISRGIELNYDKILMRPKFIHLYELQLYFALEHLTKGHPFTNTQPKNICSHKGKSAQKSTEKPEEKKAGQCYLEKANSVFKDIILGFKPDMMTTSIERMEMFDELSLKILPTPICATKIRVNAEPAVNATSIRVGIANLSVNADILLQSYHPEKYPNISLRRWTDLSKILNTAVKDCCELVVFPELSIPHHWLAELSMWSRRHQIGLVFGMEYIFRREEREKDDASCPKYAALNTTVALLPFEVEDLYKSCSISLRVKNHYSPGEKQSLQECSYLLPEKKADIYHLYNWKGTQFTIYNCFELADIKHRSLFLSELDYLIGCSWNKDIHYFNDIIDSVSRDLHCYVIYSNTSDYGCSRILQPTKSETKNIASIGGGATPTLITGDLNISKLRDFQAKPEQNGDYKPLPPGFNSCKVGKRRGKNNVGREEALKSHNKDKI